MKFLTVAILFWAVQVCAQNYCPKPKVTVLHRFPIQKSVGLYYKISPQKSELYFTGQGANPGNFSLNWQTGNIRRIAGYADPTALMDNDHLLVFGKKPPQIMDVGTSYDLQMLIKTSSQALQGDASDSVDIDSNKEKRAYPSAGGWVESDGSFTHRILLADNKAGRLYLRQFQIQNQKIVALKQGPICTNIISVLPVLSKNGQEIAAYSDSTMRIFKLPADPFIDPNCQEVDNLKRASGKIDFSFDGKKIAFHANQLSQNQETWDDTKNGGIYIYNRTTKQTKKIIEGAEELEYSFPMFTADGKLFVLERREHNNSFLLIDPENSGQKLVPPKEILPSDAKAWMAIGAVELAGCRKLSNADASTAQKRARELTRNQCVGLISQYWPDLKDLIQLKDGFLTINPKGGGLGVSESQLRQVCQLLPEDSESEGDIVATLNQNAKAVFMHRCAYCHMQNESSYSKYNFLITNQTAKALAIVNGKANDRQHRDIKWENNERNLLQAELNRIQAREEEERQEDIRDNLQLIKRYEEALKASNICKAAEQFVKIDDDDLDPLENLPKSQHPAFCRKVLEGFIKKARARKF